MPELTILPASPEATLTEMLAVVLSPVVALYQDAPNAVARHIVETYMGTTRSTGVEAHGTARFHLSTGADTVTIPTGTGLRYEAADGTILEWVTTETVTAITSETLQVDAEIKAAQVGTRYNGVPAGAQLNTADHWTQIEWVEVSEETRAGEDPETDTEFDARAVRVMARQTRTLQMPGQVRDAVLSRPEVGRCTVLDRFDPNVVGESVGHVTVAVTDGTGLPLAEESRQELYDWLADQMLASLVVHVIPPTYTDLDLTLTVEAAPGFLYADVQAGVEAALRDWMDPLNWAWWSTVTPYDLVSAIDDVPGVARVVTVPEETTLAGPAPLPRLGVVTVTVNDPTQVV